MSSWHRTSQYTSAWLTLNSEKHHKKTMSGNADPSCCLWHLCSGEKATVLSIFWLDKPHTPKSLCTFLLRQELMKELNSPTLTNECRFQFSEKGKMGVSLTQGPLSTIPLHSGMRENKHRPKSGQPHYASRPSFESHLNFPKLVQMCPNDKTESQSIKNILIQLNAAFLNQLFLRRP